MKARLYKLDDLYKSDSEKIITIRCTRDAAESLEEILNHLKVWGNIGHSGRIITDPPYGIHVPKGGRMFSFDGDGSSQILDIEITDSKIKKAWPTRQIGGVRSPQQIEKKGRKQKVQRPYRLQETVKSPTRRMGENW